MARAIANVGGHRYSLSGSRLAVLRYVVSAGTVTDAADPGLRASAGTDRLAYLALSGLNSDGMVRWALGGRDIRPTSLGRRVLGSIRLAPARGRRR